MRYRAAAMVLALAAAAAIGQVPMYSDYPWGLLDNGVDKGPVYNLNCKPPLWCSIPSYGDGVIQLGDGGVLPIWVAYANDAGWAERSLRANFSDDAGFADLSGTAFFALDAGFAFTSGSAGTSLFAFDAGAANFATSAGVAVYALDAGQANYAPTAGYAASAGTATTASTADVAAYALDAGKADYATSAGSAGTATTATYAADAGNLVCVGCIIADRLGLGAVIREKIQVGAINHSVIEDGGILGGNITPGGIGTPQLASQAITNDKLGPFAVTEDKIDAGAITSVKIQDGAVVEGKIGALAVTAGKIGAGAVTEAKIDTGAVTETKIGALAVTNGKLGDLSISSGKLQDSAVVEAKLGAGAVTNTKIGALAVDSAKLAAAAVTTAKIATGAVTSNELGALAVTTAKIAAGAVTATELGSAAVTTAKLAAGAVDTAALGTGAVTSAKFAAGAVDTAALAAGAVTNAKLGSLSVATGNLQSGAVTSNELGAGAVTNAKLASLAVATGNIQAGAVTTNELGASAVTNAKLASLAVATGNIQSGAVTSNELGALAVTTAKIANANVTTAKVADLGITDPKLNDGIPLSAYDEETVAGISSRATATNATKGAWDGSTGYIRLTLAVGSTNPQLSTGLATGTSTNLRTTNAVMRYRISGGASSNVLKMEAINTANVAQKSSTVFLADGSWHTAVFDISGWATAGTLRIDLTTNALGTAGFWDVAYIATGVAGSGTGALVSSQGNVGAGTPIPLSRLSATGSSAAEAGDGITGIAQFTTGTGINTDEKIQFGVVNGSYSWIQAIKPGTAYRSLALNPSGGNVGIGTTSPGQKLQVGNETGLQVIRVAGASSGTATGSAVYWGAGSASIFAVGQYSAIYGGSYSDLFTLYADSGRNTAFLGGGNVGINTTSPAFRLDVNGLHRNTGLVVDYGQFNGFNLYFSGGWKYAGNGFGATWVSNNTGGVDFYTAGNNTGGAGAAASLSSILATFTNGGSLGLGASAPEEKLEVRTAAAAYGLLHSDGTRKVGTYADTTGGWVGTKSNHDLHLFTNNGAKRLTVTTGGNIDIASFGTPGSETHVCSDTTGVLVLCSSSDERKKEKIETLPATLRMVLQLRPVRYEWKDKGRMGKEQDVGFIAQEVMPLFPELVGLNSDGTYLLHYDKFAPILVSAIQELYEDRTWLARRVQALEDKAEAAEKRLSDLEARLAKLEAK